MHYAAMDAACLPILYELMVQEAMRLGKAGEYVKPSEFEKELVLKEASLKS